MDFPVDANRVHDTNENIVPVRTSLLHLQYLPAISDHYLHLFRSLLNDIEKS